MTCPSQLVSSLTIQVLETFHASNSLRFQDKQTTSKVPNNHFSANQFLMVIVELYRPHPIGVPTHKCEILDSHNKATFDQLGLKAREVCFARVYSTQDFDSYSSISWVSTGQRFVYFGMFAALVCLLLSMDRVLFTTPSRQT